MNIVRLFYEEPDPDRWLPFDRYPRRVVRQFLRKSNPPGGVMRWFINLRDGLDRLGIPYSVNDYLSLKSGEGVLAHVIGKPHVLDKIPAGIPIVYGPGIAAHPFEQRQNIWSELNLKGLIVSCDWFARMYASHIPATLPIKIWPAGIDTDLWKPSHLKPRRNNRIMVYDKIRWDREYNTNTLLEPILREVCARGFEVDYIQYGSYQEDHFRERLDSVYAMIFLCEHETQGFAYLQALSMNVPILAWDRGGFWRDPSMFPHRVLFAPVTSVPYFSDQCGERFSGPSDFSDKFSEFLIRQVADEYAPRDYIVTNFDLVKQAKTYLDICSSLSK